MGYESLLAANAITTWVAGQDIAAPDHDSSGEFVFSAFNAAPCRRQRVLRLRADDDASEMHPLRCMRALVWPYAKRNRLIVARSLREHRVGRSWSPALLT